MKNKNPMVILMTYCVFITSVIKKYFSETEQDESSEEILVLIGSSVPFAILSVIVLSVSAHYLLDIPMFYTTVGSCIVLVHCYHLARIFLAERKALL